MSRKYPMQSAWWMRKENNKSIEDYMHHQREELKHLTSMVEGFFDGWPINDWDMHWDDRKNCWTIDIFPDMDNVDPVDYFHNRKVQERHYMDFDIICGTCKSVIPENTGIPDPKVAEFGHVGLWRQWPWYCNSGCYLNWLKAELNRYQ